MPSVVVKACYHVLALSVEGPDDVVVVPLPSYGLYEADTLLLGGTVAHLACGDASNGFAIRPADLEKVRRHPPPK